MDTTTADRYNFSTSRDLQYEESVYFVDHFVPVTILLVLIFVVGVSGNATTFFVYFTKYSHSNHRVLVLWLSMTDFLTCFPGIPFVLYDLHNTLTFTNVALCKIGKLLGVFFPSFSLGLLTFIASVRYIKVCMPFRTCLTTTKSHTICAIIGVLIFLILAVPAILIYGIKVTTRPDQGTEHDCTIEEQSETSVITTLQRAANAILYAVGFLICLVLYSLVGKALMKRSKMCVVDTPTRAANANEQNQMPVCKHGNTLGRNAKFSTLGKTAKTVTMGRSPKMALRNIYTTTGVPEESSSSHYPNSESEYKQRDDTKTATSDECSVDQIHQKEDNICDSDCDCMYNSEDENEHSSEDDSVKLVCSQHTCNMTNNGQPRNITGSELSGNTKPGIDNGKVSRNVNATSQQPDVDNVMKPEVEGGLAEVAEPAGPTSNNASRETQANSVDIVSKRNEILATKDKISCASHEPIKKECDFTIRVSPAINRGLERSRRLSIIFLVVTAFSFGTCLPFLIFSIIKVIDPKTAVTMAQYADINSLLTYCYFLNSALNPIVYGFMDSKFRREIKSWCKRIRKSVRQCCRGRQLSGGRYWTNR